MDLELKERVAIVTGASRGLGRAAAVSLAREGALILAAARSDADLQELSTEFGSQVMPAHCDMRDEVAVANLVETAASTFGRLDIVVNNAGIAPAGAFVEQTADEWNEVFAVNVTAPAVLCRAAGPLLLAQRSGKVINIASTSGISGKPSLVSYSASKGAVVQFTKALAAEWAADNVQVNAIAPGAFETAAQQVVLDSPDLRDRRIRHIPARRMAMPAEIGPLVCLLASPSTTFITGGVFVIDGGEAAKL